MELELEIRKILEYKDEYGDPKSNTWKKLMLKDLFKQWVLEMIGEDYPDTGAVPRVLNQQLKEIRNRIKTDLIRDIT